MFTAVTHDIKISVETTYFHHNSNPELGRHLFTYRIIIENHSEFTVQLHRRYWEIKSLFVPKRIIEGAGVVGLRPILQPGESHTYISHCPLEAEFGKMLGYFTFERIIDGTFFYAYVPSFTMVFPPNLN